MVNQRQEAPMETPERDETHVEQHGDGDVNIETGTQPEPEPSEGDAPADDSAE
jgi:hypothetical protein